MVGVVYVAATSAAAVLAATSSAFAAGAALIVTRSSDPAGRLAAAFAGGGLSFAVAMAGFVTFGLAVLPAVAAWALSGWALRKTAGSRQAAAAGFIVGLTLGVMSILLAAALGPPRPL